MGQHGGIIHQVARREVVGAIEDQVVLREKVHRIVGLQAQLVQHHVHQRVDLEHRVAGALCLGPADIGLTVDDLPLQVRFVDHVELDDPDGADAGRGQVQQCRRSQPAGSDDQHFGILETLLAVHPRGPDDQVTAVPGNLVPGQFGGWFHKRW